MALCDPSLFSNLAVAICKIKKHKVVGNTGCGTELEWAQLNQREGEEELQVQIYIRQNEWTHWHV